VQEKHSRSDNNKVVRGKNVETIIELLKTNAPATIEQLMSQSGLSYPTVFGIVKKLTEAGIAERQGYASSTGGRQALLYSLCASYAYIFGVHITPVFIHVALTNLTGGVIYEHQFALTPEHNNVEQELIKATEQALRDVQVHRSMLLAVGICVSSKIQSQLSGGGAELKKLMELRFGIPVELFPDSAVQAYLDWENLSFSGAESFLHIVFGDSVKATIYTRDKGKFEFPGSLSHVAVFPGGAMCTCGKQGCLETYFNGLEMRRIYNEARLAAGLEAVEFIDEKGKGLFRQLLTGSLMQDACADEALDKALEALAITISNLICLTEEHHVVLSGLFSSNNIRQFNMLKAAVQRELSSNLAGSLDLSMGLALPVESAIGVSRMVSGKYVCRIGERIKKIEGRSKL